MGYRSLPHVSSLAKPVPCQQYVLEKGAPGRVAAALAGESGSCITSDGGWGRGPVRRVLESQLGSRVQPYASLWQFSFLMFAAGSSLQYVFLVRVLCSYNILWSDCPGLLALREKVESHPGKRVAIASPPLLLQDSPWRTRRHQDVHRQATQDLRCKFARARRLDWRIIFPRANTRVTRRCGVTPREQVDFFKMRGDTYKFNYFNVGGRGECSR